MTTRLSRRFILSGLAAGTAAPVFANAPLSSLRPRPRGKGKPDPASAESIVKAAGLGGSVGFMAVNAATGELVDEFNPNLRLPPASVAKAATAYYSLSRLGAAHRFRTRLETTGPVENGQINGDLILRGSGDPTFDSDAMGVMLKTLKDEGIHAVRGKLRIDSEALPAIPHIDPDQPDHVSYNPAISGLNLNYNRVHFEWKRLSSGYDTTMEARALRYSPAVRIARMVIEDRKTPVYTYSTDGDTDRWSVAKGALGNGGARWLPVSRPSDYAAEVFQTIARSHGIVLRRGEDCGPEVVGTELLGFNSRPLSEMLRSMLRYSTNLTAESLGITATQAAGHDPSSLIRSARQMNLWMNDELGTRAVGFVDHSGLGYGSRVSAADMVRILQTARRAALLPKLLRPFNVDTPGATVVAKTGTLNFVSALAGYAEAPGTPPIIFAIFTADMPRRDAVSIAERERPPGARGWSRRSRTLQRRLIGRWLALARA